MNPEKMKAGYAAKKIELKTAFDEYMEAEKSAGEARRLREESFARLDEGAALEALVADAVLTSAIRRVVETGKRVDAVSRESGELLVGLNAQPS